MHTRTVVAHACARAHVSKGQPGRQGRQTTAVRMYVCSGHQKPALKSSTSTVEPPCTRHCSCHCLSQRFSGPRRPQSAVATDAKCALAAVLTHQVQCCQCFEDASKLTNGILTCMPTSPTPLASLGPHSQSPAPFPIWGSACCEHVRNNTLHLTQPTSLLC